MSHANQASTRDVPSVSYSSAHGLDYQPTELVCETRPKTELAYQTPLLDLVGFDRAPRQSRGSALAQVARVRESVPVHRIPTHQKNRLIAKLAIREERKMEIKTGSLSVVVGGQYGSEGKGAIAAFLTSPTLEQPGPVVCVRVAGPNAGHTVMGRGPDGEAEGTYPWRLRTVPVAAVSNAAADLVIAAGSEIEPAVLLHEIEWLESAGYQVKNRLYIDGQATILEEKHKQAEAEKGLTAKLGSTGKGIGAARAARIMREADLARHYFDAKDFHVVKTDAFIRKALNDGGHVVIEGTQGYGLGLHAGHYPMCTSSDARAIDFCAMAGVSPISSWVRDFRVWSVMRTFPIRVAGNSGPMLGETSWDELGLEPELTTVTQKVRRVGAFDYDLAAAAVEANGGPAVVDVALTMFDYVFPEYKNRHGWLFFDNLSADAQRYIEAIETASGALVKLLGTGPSTVLQVQ